MPVTPYDYAVGAVVAILAIIRGYDIMRQYGLVDNNGNGNGSTKKSTAGGQSTEFWELKIRNLIDAETRPFTDAMEQQIELSREMRDSLRDLIAILRNR